VNRATTFLATAAVTLPFSIGVQAQDGGPTWNPVELFGCNFVGGADMQDLNVVIDTWNEWMDENAVEGYIAFVLTPMFVSAEFPYDVLWVGIFENGAALGGIQTWLAEGTAVQDDFAEVMDCPTHQAMTLREIGEPTGIVPVEFTNCTLNEGRIGAEAGEAILELIDFYVQNGSDAGHWILLPGPGEVPDADYDFKWLTAYTSYDAIGRDFETLFNGGGLQRAGETVGRVISCDNSRIYNSQLIRGPEEE
jgi:hypothetical protein